MRESQPRRTGLLWRGWSFLAGMPLGALLAVAFGGGLASCLLGAGLGGGAMLLGVAALRRARDDDPARGAWLARAASSGLAALPALVATGLALGPGPLPLLALQLPIVAGALWRASRSHAGEAGAATQLRSAAAWLLAGALWTGVAALWSALAPGSGPVHAPERAAAIYDLDSRVVTRPVPVCPGPPRVTRRLARGARPRLDAADAWLWFDAVVDGVRQVHALELASGRTLCRTCGEPGHNRRPYPGPAGVVFESDRHASWRRPANSELYFARGGPESREPARRLTRAPGPDDHAVLAPGSGEVVWSRRRDGGYEIVSAPLASAHGSLRLGGESVWVRGGAHWIAPVAWSRDARSLVVAGGNPWAPRRARSIDFGGGTSTPLSLRLAPGGVAIDADGGVWALATTRRASALGLLPSPLVAPLAPLAGRGEAGAPRFRGTGLAVGGPRAQVGLGLPELADWGAPTGLALSRDGTRLFLAQRARSGDERILEIARGCR